MTSPLSGVRGRVSLTVLAVAACLYSLLGTIGFLAIARSGRQAIRERVIEVMGQLESGLRDSRNTVSIATPDGVTAQVLPFPAGTAAAPLPEVPAELRVVRQIEVRGVRLVLIGRASEVRLTDSLRRLWRGFWVAIPLATLMTAGAAGMAIRRALRPVADITRMADSVGPDEIGARVPVPDTGDEIEHLATTVNRMLDRIVAGRVAQRQFSSDAAHELRTPLMAIQGELELARSHPAAVDDELLDRLHALAARLGARVDDLVLLSTLDEGRRPHLERVELNGAIADEVETSTPLKVVVVGHAQVDCDPSLLARAVRNLLANAQRHARSRIEVTIEPRADHVALHVDDDGPGVAPGDRERVFQRLARLDEARSADAGGAGLGLAIVASVASALGGSVSISDGPLGGARVTMALPSTEPASPT